MFLIPFQAVTIKRSSSAQGGAGNYDVITINDDDDVVPNDSRTSDNRTSRAMTVAHPDSQSAARKHYSAWGGGGIPQKDYLSRGGTQTLGGPVKVESVTALRSTPHWLSATTSSLASTPSVCMTCLSVNLLCHVAPCTTFAHISQGLLPLIVLHLLKIETFFFFPPFLSLLNPSPDPWTLPIKPSAI